MHTRPMTASFAQTRPQARVKSFPLSQVRLLNGPFKQRQKALLRYLLMIEPDRLLAPFRLQAGLVPKAERYGGWESKDISGHSLGHCLSTLALLFAGTGDGRLRERVNYIVTEIAACQQANNDGYVLPVDKKVFRDLRAGKIEAVPFVLNGVWVPFYTLHKLLAGLRDAHRFAGNAMALDIARKVGDWLEEVLSGLTAEQIQEMLKTEHGGMNEVLVDLSVDTKDGRFLKMAARCFHYQLVLDPMFRGEDKLNGLHGNTQIPKVLGLAREYELTGEPRYRLAVTTFWDNVVNRRSYCIGGHGESEHFFPPEDFPRMLTPNTCETCNTYNLLKLTEHLFEWEPRAAQMDFVERAMTNHLAANIGRQPGEFGYFLGLGSVGVKVFSAPFDSWWCCVGTGMENPARYGEQIYFRDGGATEGKSVTETLWVNLFMGSTLDWSEKGLKLRQETRFPDEDVVRFTFTCNQPVKLRLRIRHPFWCAKPEVVLNGAKLTIDSTPSSYLSIDRTWTSGDSIVLRLPMALRLDPLPHSNGKIVAVMFGPMTLAGVVPAEPGAPDPAKQRFGDHLSARGKTDEFPPLFVVPNSDEVLANLKPTDKAFGEFQSEGVVKPADLVFIPFYRIYEEHYAVYFPVMAAVEWKARETELLAEQERRKMLDAATLDTVTPGYQQPEVEHNLRSGHSVIRDFLDRKCRESEYGGWFSYDMAVLPSEPMALWATYWGGEWVVRNFDILIDGEKIATQRLRANRPGDFFDEVYAIPPVLTKDKGRVTVQFQAHTGSLAGGVFGLRMMRSNPLLHPLSNPAPTTQS